MKSIKSDDRFIGSSIVDARFAEDFSIKNDWARCSAGVIIYTLDIFYEDDGSETQTSPVEIEEKIFQGVWERTRAALIAIALGLTLRQNGDSEGTLSFKPANGPQSTLALRIAKARAKRILSPERAAAGAARLARARLARLAGQNVAQNAQNPHQNGPLGV